MEVLVLWEQTDTVEEEVRPLADRGLPGVIGGFLTGTCNGVVCVLRIGGYTAPISTPFVRTGRFPAYVGGFPLFCVPDASAAMPLVIAGGLPLCAIDVCTGGRPALLQGMIG